MTFGEAICLAEFNKYIAIYEYARRNYDKQQMDRLFDFSWWL